MTIQTQPFVDLIAQAEEGALQLPEFQRNWKWGPRNVIELFDSIRQGFPIGAFLLMDRNPNVPITARPFFKSEAGEIPPSSDGLFVLDGQQRLTAGLILFTDRGKSRFFIDLDRLHSLFQKKFPNEAQAIQDSEYSDQTAEARSQFLSELDSDDQYCLSRRKSLDATDLLLKSHLLATAWLRDAETLIAKLSQYKRSFPERSGFIEYVVQSHFVLKKDLQVPVTVVERDRSVEAICRIFSTLNTTGKPLTPFELVVAILYPNGIRLRDDVESRKQRSTFYRNMDSTGEILLQTIAMLDEKEPKKSKLPKTITPELYRSYAEKAYVALEDLGNFLTGRMGLGLDQTGNLIPYDSIYAPMALVFNGIREKRLVGTPLHEAERKLERWLVISALDRRYQDGVHGKQLDDLKFMRSWILEGGAEPAWMTAFRMPSLRNDSTSGARANLVRCLMNRNSPRDVISGNNIGYGTTAEQTEAHHLFPMAYAKNTLQIEKPDLVLNMLLTSQPTNLAWSNSNPYDQITQAIQSRGEAAVKDELYRQFVDEEAFALLRKSPIAAADFYKFLDLRERRIVKVLGEWGVSEGVAPADASDDDDDID